jgi:hypothetical protein
LIDVLGLDKPHWRKNSSRIEDAVEEAAWYQDRGHQNMEGLARISCEGCGNRSLFRLFIWEKRKPNTARVFRFPDLGYALTVANGVGIAVCDKRIIGDMVYGTPACKCRLVEEVELSDKAHGPKSS